MTECQRVDVRDVLPDLASGALDPRARADVEAHLATCAGCAAELALVQRLREHLRSAAALDVNEVSRSLAGARVRDARATSAGGRAAAGPADALPPAWQGRARTRSGRQARGWAIAAVAVLALVGGAYAFDRARGAGDGDPMAGASAGTSATAADLARPSGRAPAAGARPRTQTVSDLPLDAAVADASDAELAELILALAEMETLPGEDPFVEAVIDLPDDAGGRY